MKVFTINLTINLVINLANNFINKVVNANKMIISTLLMITLITSCGFQLRGNYLLDPKLQTLYVSSVDKYGELTRLVKQHLMVNHVTLVDHADKNIPEMRILKDNLSRRTLSVFQNGQVAEYEIVYTVRYQLRIEDEKAREYKFSVSRDYQDDPNIALAKSRELNLLLSEMRKEAADKILRGMAAVQL